LMLLLPLLVTGCVGFCGGLGGSEVTLYVSDAATGRSIAAPTFSEDGSFYSATCGADSCTLRLEENGERHEIVVGATGYRPQTVEVTTSMDSFHLAVELHAQ